MRKRYLPLYEQWSERGGLTHSRGLCQEFSKLAMPESKLLLEEIFSPPPNLSDAIEHWWWGSGKNKDPKFGEFTPLRQNIVLLMAAMNNEL
jgi:hypothetical protein